MRHGGESAQHREVHFWAEGTAEPPCGTLEDRYAWSDSIEEVTCEACREALAGDAGGLAPERDALEDDRPSF